MTEDEHPNERLVTPSEDGEGFDRSSVSRRSLLGGSALLAGLLAYTSDPTQPTNPNVGVARASHNPDEPLIILGPESDPIGYLFQDTAGGIILQDATSGNHFWYNESEGRWETDAELNVPALIAEELDVTNETFIRGTRSSSSSSTNSGTFVNLLDGESKDVRGEFNSSAQFVPDETGEYEITAIVELSGGTAADRLRTRVQDVDAQTTVEIIDRGDYVGDFVQHEFSFQDLNLTAGTKYEIQITNDDSSFTVQTGSKATIKRTVVG